MENLLQFVIVLVRVGGLIGTATSDKAGLMPSLAYSSTSVYNMTTYRLLKLFSVNEPWMRKHAVVEYGGTSDDGYAMVSAVNKDGLIECNLFVQGSIYPLEFYQKDNSIFLYANQTGTYSKAFIRSCDLIATERVGSTDMSGYTKISQS